MLHVGIGGLEAAEVVSLHERRSSEAIPGLGSVEHLEEEPKRDE